MDMRGWRLLTTADGTDDDLIKFEGVPDGYVLKVPGTSMYSV